MSFFEVSTVSSFQRAEEAVDPRSVPRCDNFAVVVGQVAPLASDNFQDI